jgi:glutamyl-tRNA synthetase
METIKHNYPEPEKLIGYLGWLAGQLDKPEALTALELAQIFDPQKFPKHDIVVPKIYVIM